MYKTRIYSDDPEVLLYSLIDPRRLNTPEPSSGSIMMLKTEHLDQSLYPGLRLALHPSLAEVRSVVFV